MHWLSYGDSNLKIRITKQKFQHSYCFSRKDIESELEYQKYIINKLSTYLNIQYNGSIEVYLYPKEIARKKIYTESGGFAAIGDKKSSIHYVSRRPRKCNNGNLKTCLGIHETAHILTIKEIGKPHTLFMTEGIVEAIEDIFIADSYKQKDLAKRMELIKKTGRKYLTIQELINTNNNSILEILSNDFENIMGYYYQSGFCVKWLLNQLSIEQIKTLFIMNKEQLVQSLEKIFNQKILLIESKYKEYLDNMF